MTPGPDVTDQSSEARQRRGNLYLENAADDQTRRKEAWLAGPEISQAMIEAGAAVLASHQVAAPDKTAREVFHAMTWAERRDHHRRIYKTEPDF